MSRIAPGWAADDGPRQKFERNLIEIPRFARIERAFELELHGMVSRYVAGDLAKDELMRRFSKSLRIAETEAYVAGRRARGDLRSSITVREAEMMELRHQHNLKYFSKFADQMAAGKGRMNYMRRAGLYAKSLWSLYTRGETTDWQDPKNENARGYWILDIEAEHCGDCVKRAEDSRKNNGFSFDELIEKGWPGDGSTECGTSCRCHVWWRHKAAVLPERYKDMKKAVSADSGIKTLEELLGGPELPLQVPAAGVPYVNLQPEVVAESLQRAARAAIAIPRIAVPGFPIPEPGGAKELARRLPLIPMALTQPATIVENKGLRHYFGYGLELVIARDAKGHWYVVQLSLANMDDINERITRRAA